MGQVYRARDTKLHRDVALKVLPDAFAGDPARLARFTREAQTLASLNHPNIAHIHGLEESGGVRALVMELVEGEDLSQRIARGAIPIEEALPIAQQIAEALDAAHDQGIIHRDLKPANIKVRTDGTVKVLDFGLAKAMEPFGSSPNVTKSPTITTPAMTAAGMILGTAAYMSPEQARGKTVDKRADIWAFGVLLFEMLTGKRAFDGEDVGDTLAAVLRAEPVWSRLPAETVVPVRTLLRGCLEKDPRQRIGSMSAALFVLRHQIAGEGTEVLAGHPGPKDGRRVALFTTAALIVGAVGAGAGVWWLTRFDPPSVVRTTIATSGPTALVVSDVQRSIAITPDGSRVVYRGDNQLLVRALDQLQPTALSGLGAPQGVFLSPDGEWIGFVDGNRMIRKVSITGGPAELVCAVGQGVPTGATWGPDGTIIFATNAAGRGLQRVPAAGGEPTALTTVDRARGETGHLWPEFLPGGEAVLFTILASPSRLLENAQIAVVDLRTGTSKVLIRGGSHASYVPTGHLVYGVSGTLRAVAFDLKHLAVVGTPATVLEGVVTTALGAANIAVAANGSLVYVAGGALFGSRQTVVSVDRQGRASPLPGIPLDAYRTVRVSPDGTKLALATFEQVSIYDFARATLNRLTTDPASDSNPLWTPDGQRLVFTSMPAGYPELFVRRADGTGSVERVLSRAKDLIDLHPDGWSKDGKHLLFSEVTRNVCPAIGQVAFERPSEAKLLVKGDGCSVVATVSPDGRWIAYTSGTPAARRLEIFVERYPELGDRQQISTGGGDVAVWSRNSRELFFMSLDGRQMFAASMQSGTTLVAGRPQMLFESAMPPSGGGYRPYDIAPDGRFLIIQRAQAAAGTAAAPEIVVVLNWFEELKRLVPTN